MWDLEKEVGNQNTMIHTVRGEMQSPKGETARPIPGHDGGEEGTMPEHFLGKRDV